MVAALTKLMFFPRSVTRFVSKLEPFLGTIVVRNVALEQKYRNTNPKSRHEKDEVKYFSIRRPKRWFHNDIGLICLISSERISATASKHVTKGEPS